MFEIVHTVTHQVPSIQGKDQQELSLRGQPAGYQEGLTVLCYGLGSVIRISTVGACFRSHCYYREAAVVEQLK